MAVNYCKNTYQGSLVEIHDAVENSILSDIILSLNETDASSPVNIYWIGLVDRNGTFDQATWINSNTTLGSWHSWEPGFEANSSKLCAGAYVANTSSHLNWTNLKCCESYRFICQLGKIELK